VREATLDQADGSFQSGGSLWREDDVEVVGHDYEGVKLVVPSAAVVLKCFEE
jgi:hypothetical protein